MCLVRKAKGFGRVPGIGEATDEHDCRDHVAIRQIEEDRRLDAERIRWICLSRKALVLIVGAGVSAVRFGGTPPTQPKTDANLRHGFPR